MADTNDNLKQNLEFSDTQKNLSPGFKVESQQSHAEARALMKDLMAEVANPFSFTENQGKKPLHYADSGQFMSDATVSDKELLASCDTNGDGVIKGLKERGCEAKLETEVIKKDTEATKKDIEATKKRVEQLRQNILDKVSK